ncbi:MAG: DUF1800 domain-containing protein [Tepidisphaeraceae bacterium]
MSQTNPPTDPFSPLVPSADAPLDTRLVCHVLRRCAFGATPERLARFKDKSPADVIDWLLEYDPAGDPFESLVDGLEGFVNLTQPNAVASYWFYRMLNTPSPMQERIALFWHGRFATGAGKVGNGRMMAGQIQTFRAMGLGSFRELCVAVGRDPAMLIWLDGTTNRKGKANENYAREVMELFTLGIGNYSERDVQELARAFTGWRVSEEKAVFNPRLFDDGEKEIFGRKGKFDSESAVDVLLAQPAAAKYLASNLLKEFVHPQPTPEHVDHYARRVIVHDWNIKPLLREMLLSRLFFSDWAYRARIKSPVELTVGAALAMGGKVSTDFLRESSLRLGQNLLNPPNVKGWPGDTVWINSNTVLLRFNFAMQMATQRQREFVRKAELNDWLKDNDIKSDADVLNHLALLLLDGQMPDEARSKFIDYMNRDAKNETKAFKLSADSINSKVRGLMHMMMTMPEYQLA